MRRRDEETERIVLGNACFRWADVFLVSEAGYASR